MGIRLSQSIKREGSSKIETKVLAQSRQLDGIIAPLSKVPRSKYDTLAKYHAKYIVQGVPWMTKQKSNRARTVPLFILDTLT